MPGATRRARPQGRDGRAVTSLLESATGWQCGLPAAPKDAETRPAARSPPDQWQCWRQATGNDGGIRRRAPSGRRGWREQPGARRGLDERQTWMRWTAKRKAAEGGFRCTPTWRAKCQISGSGRPLRFEHWGARGDLSPTDLRPISLRDLCWKQQKTQGTRGLYWFGPPLWCNTLLQCVV